MEIRYLGILPGERYIDVRALVDLSVCHIVSTRGSIFYTQKKNHLACHGNALIILLTLALTLPFKTLFFFNIFIWVLIGKAQSFLTWLQEVHSCMPLPILGEHS
jgi:hypothetical protein